MTTPTDPTTPTTPGTQTAADVGHTASANGVGDSALAEPAAGPEPASLRLGPAVALREQLAAAIDAAPRCVHPGWESCSQWSRADAALAVFADWLRSDPKPFSALIFELATDPAVARPGELSIRLTNALADLIDATVERPSGSAPVAAGSTPAASPAGSVGRPPDPAGPAD